ncbi:putative ABC multidrug efflux transporter [Synechococcus sp. A18-25c]|uniref:ABC transporter ATP-binding protein n=1 Tax=unclassified Synechococcus TaxID=2626047 RepID=UPI0016472EC1|nr:MULTISPECIES: ABC transporter ATP-binding protein [unclassified Synechococcus]MEC7248483.1 ABC transporter ATP-binding protein [Cyanobacteriota bacterium]MEC8096188.1 ABC transporter ATP-binding protein [Cyanobacteriota bacterium]QNI48191.1 putative ABC multidrug efflux transporter [Synechococcus sp. A15-60]QNJ19825.1 putative ABC multidrug efflux transporter [Synechococcus sp. A18-25c]
MLKPSEAGFRRLLPLLRPHLRQLVVGLICMLVYVSSFLLLLNLAGDLFPALGSRDLGRVLSLIGQGVLIFAVQKLAQFGQDSLLAGPALQVSKTLRSDLFSKLQTVELGALEKLSAGDLTYRLTEDADRVSEVLYKSVHDTLPSVLQLFAVLGYMLWLDWKLTASILLLAPLIIWLISMFGARVMTATERSQKKVSELAGLLGEAIEGLPLVRAFAAEPWLQGRFEEEIDQHRKARHRTYSLVALQHPVVGMIEVVGLFSVLGLAAWRIQSNDLSIAGLSSYLTGLVVLIDPIAHVTNNFNEFQQGQASLRRLRQIERQPQEAADPNPAIPIGRPAGHLNLREVNFAYGDGEPVLNDINLSIHAGQVVALVGPSGAGKSTLFSLLLRFNTAQSGEIELDGANLSQVKARELRKQVALVPQRTTVFSGSIADAILFGREASHQQLTEAARLANAHDFIMALPKGYDTQLEERGTNVSGGQLQRIAIARAVLGNPAVLLLDEATSALDAEAEAAVQLGLRQAMHGRTVLVIAHRLATVQEADQIVVLDQGRISEEGTHDQLMASNGRYRDLCERQMIRDGRG